ncbi:trypsin 3A1-like [Ostrinia furnacalis]|uniref:trypsin 3A1-like n=1 Tax=Ostrinia furnacalis TaxID=93504 RepID=UPI0010398886|nr:trypsin 3A1-like [Ostrinia furnacalis]
MAILFVVIVNATSHPKFRVIQGVDDEDNKYPYVVSLEGLQSKVPGLEFYRMCTGTLIAPEWVLTAGHCLLPQLEIVRYGNMSIPRNATESTRRILKRIPHPNYKGALFIKSIAIIKNDIGLVLVEEIQMMVLGKLSAVDYRTLNGEKVTYAGYGGTGETLDVYKPLQLGESMVRSCLQSNIPDPRIPFDIRDWGPTLCAVPKCTLKDHAPGAGDSGGPVFLNDKVVAVISGPF